MMSAFVSFRHLILSGRPLRAPPTDPPHKRNAPASVRITAPAGILSAFSVFFEIGEPVDTSHQHRAADDIAQCDRQQISYEKITRRKIPYIGYRLRRCRMVDFIRICQKACHPVIHIGYAVLKSAEDKEHDRQKEPDDLPRYRSCRKTDPDGDAHQEIT